jgi:cytochrome P450
LVGQRPSVPDSEDAIMVPMSTDRSCPFDPMSPALWSDPYPTYRLLREQSPVVKVEPPSRWQVLLSGGLTATSGFWLLTRYADIAAAMTHPGLGHQIEPAREPGTGATTPDRLLATIEKWPLFLDPPDHGRIRKPLVRALANLPFAELEARVAHAARAQWAVVAGRSEIDVIKDFAYDIPMRLMAGMLGVSEADQAMLTSWSSALYGALELGAEENSLALADRLLGEALEYFRHLAAERRRQPRDDLMTSLLQARAHEQAISEDEMLATCILMLFAGQDTTLNVIGCAALALLGERNHLDQLAARGGVDENVFREFIRYQSPQQLAFRYALQDIELSGQGIAAGDLVCLALGSANRDPEMFSAPDQLDFDRKNTHHLAFGKGLHICPGSRLGGVISRAALAVLIDPLRCYELRHWEWESNAIMRGLKSLEVVLH